MAIITPAKFTELKALVKAECLRRNQVGSVASYGGSAYDFSRTPVSDNTVVKEFYEKIAVPLNAINGTTPTSGARIIDDGELDSYKQTVTNLSNIALTSSNTGCASSCTGLCQNTCTGSCTGCTGSCTGGCSGSCSGGCDGCSGGCDGCGSGCAWMCTSCSGGCSDICTGCTEACTSCQGSCMNSCTGDCEGSCVDGCAVSCSSTCYNSASCTVF